VYIPRFIYIFNPSFGAQNRKMNSSLTQSVPQLVSNLPIESKDHDLIQKVIHLASQERKIGVEILELLYEIEKRKAYADLGYDGLYSFCIHELRYSDSQAYRRITAMRAMHELPELKEKIKKGELTVTTVSQVQTHLRQNKRKGIHPNRAEKLDLFKTMQNLSSHEVEKTLQTLNGEEVTVLLTIKLEPEMQKAWEEIRNRSAHATHGQPTEILNMLMQEWLKKHQPKTEPEKTDAKTKAETDDQQLASVSNDTRAKTEVTTLLKKGAVRQLTGSLRARKRPSRHIPAQTRRSVLARDKNQCTNCGSEFALQIEHKKPYAKKGDHSCENLKALCRSCNLRAGIREFGTSKMRRS